MTKVPPYPPPPPPKKKKHGHRPKHGETWRFQDMILIPTIPPMGSTPPQQKVMKSARFNFLAF